MNGISFNHQDPVFLMKKMPGDLLLPYHRLSLRVKARNNFISPGILEILSSYLGTEDNAGKPSADMKEDETFSWLDFHPRGFFLY